MPQHSFGPESFSKCSLENVSRATCCFCEGLVMISHLSKVETSDFHLSTYPLGFIDESNKRLMEDKPTL